MRDEIEIRAGLAQLPRLLTLKQGGAELGLPVWTLRTAIWKGELAHVRIGRQIRIDKNDLEDWLTRQKRRSPSL
ncbi:MAG TPA: helix-turn-helix domain-containing protein [Terriglobales bacterium]|nr:helix-turn-helix domain-containing protein [Terriglobales bacterium]